MIWTFSIFPFLSLGVEGFSLLVTKRGDHHDVLFLQCEDLEAVRDAPDISGPGGNWI